MAFLFLPRPHQHARENRDGDEQSPAGVCLEALHLSPSSEPQEGPGTEETEPKSPEGTIRGSLGPAEAGEAAEQVVVPPLGRMHSNPWAGTVSANCISASLARLA